MTSERVPKIFTAPQIKEIMDGIVAEISDGTFPRRRPNDQPLDSMSRVSFGLMALLAFSEAMTRLGMVKNSDDGLYEPTSFVNETKP